MAGRRLTIEDFPLKTEGTDRCWIHLCHQNQRTSGLCRAHYDSARYHGVLEALTAQIDARSEAPSSPEAELRALKDALAEAVGAHPEPLNPLQQVALLQRRAARGGTSALAVLKVWAAGMHADLVDIPTDPDDARAWAEQEWAKQESFWQDRTASRDGQYLRALLDILEVRYDDPRPPDDADGGLTQMARTVLQNWAQRQSEAIPAPYRAVLQVWAGGLRVELAEMPEAAEEARAWAAAVWSEERSWVEAQRERSDLLGSVRRLADELTAVDQALGPYRLEAAQGNRIAAIEALAAPSGPVLLSEASLRERFSRLNEIEHAESLLAGLSEPLHEALWVVLEEQKARVLRVCP